MSKQTKSTPSTGILKKLTEANAQLAEESTALMARNAALEENTLHIQAELRKREEELVKLGQQIDLMEAEAQRADLQYGAQHNENKELKSELNKTRAVGERECEALRNANADLLDQLDEMEGRYKRMTKELDSAREFNKNNAQRAYAVIDKAHALESENVRLRKTVLEQATLFASILKDIMPR